MADGHIKVTRDDWLDAAWAALVRDGVDTVKVLALATQLDVSRSSFYWYFKNRDELPAALLDHCEERNTRSIVRQCALEAGCINEAACNFFRCFIDPALFNRGLDFAVRACPGEPPSGGPVKMLVHDRPLVHWDEAFWRGRAVSQGAMRPDGIVMDAPPLDQDLGFPERVEYFSV